MFNLCRYPTNMSMGTIFYTCRYSIINLHFRRHFAKLLLSCYLDQGKKMIYWKEASTFTVIPPTSSSELMGQWNIIEGITFGSTLIFISMLNFQPSKVKNDSEIWWTNAWANKLLRIIVAERLNVYSSNTRISFIRISSHLTVTEKVKNIQWMNFI